MNKFVKIIRWRLGIDRREARPFHAVPKYTPQYATPDLGAITHPDPQKIQVTWIGHATFLIQVAGLNILTDPIWSTRASPISFAGPKRVAKPGIPFGYLPAIDLVLISHTHYDHLDLPTVRKLGNAPHYILPEGVTSWFLKRKLGNAEELRWWESTKIGDVTVHAVPARHWSKRSLFKEPFMGWCGYVLETSKGNIFFAADTAYEESHFKEIGKKLGPFELSLIPIGAYSPRWFMSEFHIDPPEAVQIHQEVRSRRSIGMHWGTFALTSEPIGEPPLYLAKEMDRLRLPKETFTTTKLGETVVI